MNKLIKVKELSDFKKWLEVISFSGRVHLIKEQYLTSYEKGKSLLTEPVEWDKIHDEVEAGYTDEKQGSEIYLRLVEAYFETEIKDGATLWELTINEDQDKEDKEGIEYSQFLVGSSNVFRYEIYLYYLISNGAKYKDLIKAASEFNLPKSWEGLSKDQDSAIAWALSHQYLIDEPGGLMLLPNLRSIAEDLEAPYSVLMDAYKITNNNWRYE